MRRLLREPLVHFLLAGALLFAAYRFLNPEPERDDTSHRIELTADDLRQMTVAWLAQGRPQPTAEQMRALVQDRIREEILYREALALGLDQDDSIVKRRMAQKMQFLAEDIADLRDPTQAELEAWFEQNAQRFEQPPRISFRHLYFSPDLRRAQAREAAATALAKLVGQSRDGTQATAAGDPFMLQDYYGDRAPEQVAKEFGGDFARALFELEPGSWQGPIESGYGWHLVLVEARTPSRMPALEEVEAEVRSEWVSAQRDELQRKAFEAMKARYQIVLPPELDASP